MGYGLANTVVGAATAVVFVHCGDDLFGSGCGIAIDEGCRRHDLAAHAPPTLRHLQVEKCLLDRVERAIGIGQSLNRANFFAHYAIDWGLTRTRWYAIDMNGTGTTNAGSTADFGAGQV